MELTVECQTRPESSKPRALRREGRIPANLYGHQGTESVSLTLDAKTAERLVKAAAVNNTLINLNVTDMPWKGKTLLREVQVHPAKRSLYHLSFFAVAGHGDTDVEVPVNFVGEAVGVKQGGIIDTVITTLPVRCKPESIPDTIEVDVSNLNVGDSVYVENLNLPEGVTTSVEPNQVVVSILGQQASAEPVETQSESESESETQSETQSESATS